MAAGRDIAMTMKIAAAVFICLGLLSTAHVVRALRPASLLESEDWSRVELPGGVTAPQEPWCSHTEAPDSTHLVIPGTYQNGGDLTGQTLKLRADHSYQIEHHSCTGDFGQTEGTWVVVDDRILFSTGLGFGESSHRDRVIVHEGVLAIHNELRFGYCFPLLLSEAFEQVDAEVQSVDGR